MTERVTEYPQMIVPAGHVEPVPRRLRGYVADRLVFDTRRAWYVWLWPGYPQFAVPPGDIAEGALVDEGTTVTPAPGPARRHTLRLGKATRPGAAWVWQDGAPAPLVGHASFRWSSLDAWFEEDEQVFVHPRSPYTRVDALHSGRPVRVERDGVRLADAPYAVLVFETGLPTRYYLPRTCVDFSRLTRSDTVTSCPYKGTTSSYWSVTTGRATHPDLAWSYDFPTRQLAPIATMVAFYNEHVDLFVDGEQLPRPEPVGKGMGRQEYWAV